MILEGQLVYLCLKPMVLYLVLSSVLICHFCERCICFHHPRLENVHVIIINSCFYETEHAAKEVVAAQTLKYSMEFQSLNCSFHILEVTDNYAITTPSYFFQVELLMV